MASTPKLDSSSSSPDGMPFGSQRGSYLNSSNLERSGNNRDGHDGRMVLGTSSTGGTLNSSVIGGGVDPPLSQVLFLELLPFGEVKLGRHLDLKRATNAAVGTTSLADPNLGSVPSRALEAFGPEELRKVRAGLVDSTGRARDRIRHLDLAMSKLEKYRTSMQSRKRSRPDGSAPVSLAPPVERSLSSLGVAERTVASVHSMKGNSGTGHSQVTAHSDSAMQKPGDKSKRVAPNKRVRTSMADARPDARVANVNIQRPSVSVDRDRDMSRAGSVLTSPVDENERVVIPSSEGREKTKMKGRRSGPATKVDSSSTPVANGGLEGDREHKWSGQQHRMNADSRSRPSEGHGFRSGPVHGITSVHKAESSSQMNGIPVRVASKSETEGALLPASEKGDRAPAPDRERIISKNGIKLSPSMREDVHPPGVTKTKAARGPRSSSVSGLPSHLGRSSSFAENRERHVPPTAKIQMQAQPQIPSVPPNRKRPAPTKSSSPTATQWVGQRPQKMARSAARRNPIPGQALAREEPNPLSDGTGARENLAATPTTRPSPGLSSGSGVARRVSVSSSHTQAPSSKPKNERVSTSAGLSGSDDSEDELQKAKKKAKKQGEWEPKPMPNQKMVCLTAAPAKKTRVVTKEEGGDGIRRQGRSGRGVVAPRTGIATPVEKVEVSASAKQIRSVRVGPEKHDRVGRPPAKKDSVDRKSLTRPRRLVGNGLAEISGPMATERTRALYTVHRESDDDREELTNAVRKAVDSSANGCTSTFWKQMEPFFAYLTAADMSFVRQQSKDIENGDPVLQIPPCGDPYTKMDFIRSTPPVSPSSEAGYGKSVSLSNGNVETDVFVAKLFHNSKEKQDASKGKGGLSGGWSEKLLPLSQRLLAALIQDGDLAEGRRGSDENYHDNRLEGGLRDESPFRSSISGSERLDGDSDGEVGRREIQRWNSGGKDVITTDGSALPNGNASQPGLSNMREDSVVDGDDVIVAGEVDSLSSGSQLTIHEDEAGGEHGVGGNDEQRNRPFEGVPGLTSAETQYQRMTVDERIVLELRSVGIHLQPLTQDVAHREDDEISEELRKLQRDLKEQVETNKERVRNLEKAVLASKEKEERDREKLAMEKLVEIAYAKRMGPRGSSGGKSSASKSAKTAGLAFAKRVLARVRAFDSGQSCFDSQLKDMLFFVTPRGSESTIPGGGVEGVATATAFIGEIGGVPTTISPKSSGALASEAGGARPAVRRADVKAEKDLPLEGRPIIAVPSGERAKEKEDSWPVRAKEKEVLLEDVVGGPAIRESSALGANLVAGTKGKRSERERDGKGHGKESQSRSDSSKGSRPGANHAKSERKTKTKPRQKTAPLLKAVNGLLAKPTPEPVKDRVSTTSSSSTPLPIRAQSNEGLEVPVAPAPSSDMPVPGTHVPDLSNLPIPGMEDFNEHDIAAQGQDLGSWLDFEEDPQMAQDSSFMGLEVPMDDLAELGFMM